MNLLLKFSLIAIFLFSHFAISQEPSSVVNVRSSKRIYATKSIGNTGVPIIDGKLDDAEWNIVEWGNDFIEWRPDENTPPSEQTQFKIIYDAKFLYIGIRAFDKSPDSIVKRLGRRDQFDGDWVEVNIDSYHDLRTGFSFKVSAAGVKGDEFISDNGNNWDGSWNPIWYTKSNIDEKGWTCEIKIPFSQLRFGNEKEQIWGLQLNRRIFRKEERSLWQRVPTDASGWVSEMGELHGLKELKPQKQLEIQPFTVTQLETYPAEEGNPYRDGSDFKLNGGLDAKIGVTNDLTLDLTVNPDFGQVEADPSAINLDGFEIFFEEQRPFFVENKNIFDYRFGRNQDNLFFSRRIGRSPQGSPDVSDDAFVDQPQNTTILGAAKFSGKTKNGWSIGILESLTGKEFAEIDLNGERRKELVEPSTNYFVGRLQKDFNNRNSYVGGIFTATNRKLDNNLDYLRKSAYSGGLDFKHQWKDREYFVEGNIVASHVTGSKEAITDTQESLTHLFQRVDAGHVDVDPNKTSLSGTGGRFSAGKVAGGNWTYDGGLIWRSPELELNDIGFLRQADEIRQYFNLGYRTLKPFGSFREIRARFEQFTTYDFDGNYNRIQYELNWHANFKNNWWIDMGAAHKPRIFSNTILRGGPRYKFSRENFSFGFFGSDRRKKLSFNGGYVYSQAKQNHFSFLNLEAGLNYQPSDALSISVNPEFSKNPNKTQYVTETDFNGTPRYITAKIDNQTLSAAIRVNYTINPDLTVQYYGQPFISRGRYTNFNYITNPIADDLNDRFQLFNDNQISYNEIDEIYLIDEDVDGNTDYEIEDPDFSFVQFRSNLVVRWEYIPGSEIFLVWSQGITTLTDPSNHLFKGLETGILDQKPDNIFLIKATYRFVL